MIKLVVDIVRVQLHMVSVLIASHVAMFALTARTLRNIINIKPGAGCWKLG